MTEADVRLQLAREEEEDAARGTVNLHEVTPLGMVATLLDLEEEQCVIVRSVTESLLIIYRRKFRYKYPRSQNGTPLQTAEVFTKRAALRHRINSLREVQAIYMPCVPQNLAAYRTRLVQRARHEQESRVPTSSASTPSSLLAIAPGACRSCWAVDSVLASPPSSSALPDPQQAPESSSSSSTSPSNTPHPTSSTRVGSRRRYAVDPLDLPEDQPLFLPHSLSMDDLDTCHAGLAEIEGRLRDEQMRDEQMREALDKVRIHLHIKSRIVTFKNRNVRHQELSKAAREKIDKNDDKIKAFVEKYRAACHAKVALGIPGDWERVWKPLHDNDVRCLQEADPLRAGETEGRRVVSWIWMAADKLGGRETDTDHVRGLNNGAWL